MTRNERARAAEAQGKSPAWRERRGILRARPPRYEGLPLYGPDWVDGLLLVCVIVTLIMAVITK